MPTPPPIPLYYSTAGILEGKRATAHPAFSDRLTNQAAVPERVVVDGKLVTSRWVGGQCATALGAGSFAAAPLQLTE